MFLISSFLRNKYLPEKSGVDMSTPVHPMAPPLEPLQSNDQAFGNSLQYSFENVTFINFTGSV